MYFLFERTDIVLSTLLKLKCYYVQKRKIIVVTDFAGKRENCSLKHLNRQVERIFFKTASSCVRGNSGSVPETYSKKQHMELTSS